MGEDNERTNPLVEHLKQKGFMEKCVHYGVCNIRLGFHDACNAYQMMCLNALECKTFDESKGDANGYLFRSYINEGKVLAKRNRRWRRNKEISQELLPDFYDGNVLGIMIAEEIIRSESIADHRDDQRYRRLLESPHLSQKNREILNLDYQGFSDPQIAERLKIKEGTVKSRLHAARARLENLRLTELRWVG